MKKLLLGSLALLAFSNIAHSYTIDTEACAGVEYVHDLSGELVIYEPNVHTFVTASTPVFYAGYENISYFIVGPARYTQILITNVSDRQVGFFYRPTYRSSITGAPSTITGQTFSGNFSTTNSPLDASGADLPADHLGIITLTNSSPNHYGTASIYWDSSVCGEAPIVASVSSEYVASSRAGMTLENVNNGKAF